MKKKSLMIGGGIVLAVLVIILVFLLIGNGSESDTNGDSEDTEQSVVEKIKDTLFGEEEEEELEDLNDDGVIDEEDEAIAQANRQNSSGSNEDARETDSDKDSSKENSTANKEIELPYTIPGTNLVIEKIAGYDGVYIEDGSDTDVSGVATILVKNAGSEAVEYADISFKHGGVDYSFKVSALPSGSKAAVQEENKASYKKGKSESCTASTAVMDKLEMSEKSVKVTDNGDGSLTVKNVSKQNIPAVRVFYKFYMDEEDSYIGGITYTAKVENLKAGDSQTIRPSHYDSDASKVMMVRTYDTTE